MTNSEDALRRATGSSAEPAEAVFPAPRDARDGARGRQQAAPEPSADCANFLGPDSDFSGTVEVEDGVRLEGNFKGEIRTKGTLQVVTGSHVNAKVQAAFVVIAGQFEGEVRCEQRIDLLSSGRAQGKLVTNGLAVESGAVFDGQVEMTAKSSSSSGNKKAASAEAST